LDVTDKKKAELAMRESQERLALVMQGSYDGIWDWDLTTNKVYFSPRWKNVLGYQEQELPDVFSTWEQLLHPDDQARARATVNDYLTKAIPNFELEHRLRHKDGTYRWMLARGVALRDEQGKPTRMAGCHVDLTERKEAEQELHRAYLELAQNEDALRKTLQDLRASNEELKSAQLQLIQAAKLESVGTLAAGIAHEVKNPLQTMIMGLDFLDRNLQPRDNNALTVLADMRDAVSRANSIVKELLTFSAANHSVQQSEDLNGIIERSLWLIHGELMGSQIKVVRQLDQELPKVEIDAVKIEQVFINLFINAIQAMTPGGTLTVSTTSMRLEEGARLLVPAAALSCFRTGDELVLARVEDTGGGISEEHLTKIFDPFFTTKPVGVGTGLGLSVVKKIIDLHGGVIDIRNGAHRGVAATVILKTSKE